MKNYPDRAVIEDAREIAELSPSMVELIERHNARQKVLLDEWIQYVAQQRARNDAKSAVNVFIVICVLIAIAVSFLMLVSGGLH